MSIKSYPQDNDYKPGSWKGLKTPEGRSASFSCPVCGKLGTLQDHQIAADGTVTPSVVCSYGCGFHEFVRLEGWTQET